MTGVSVRAFGAAHLDEPGLRGALARHWSLIVTLVVAGGYMVTVTLLHSPALSPIDEVVYIDYLEKLWRQGVIHSGEYLGDLARQLYACHGVIPFGRMGPECGTDLSDSAAFPYGGYSSGEGYPPVQFWIVRTVGDALSLIPGVGQVTGWRLVGTLWLMGGLVFSYLIARRMRIVGWGFVAVSLAIVASPLGYWSFSFVSTDAPIFCLGAILLWLAIRFARGEVSGWWLVGVAALGATFKPTGIAVVGLVLIYLVARRIRALRAEGRDARGVLRGLLGPQVGLPLLAFIMAVAVQFAWTRIVPLLAISRDSADQGVAVPPTVDLFGQQFTNFLGGALRLVVPQADSATNIFLPLTWLAIAGVIGSLLMMPRGSRDRSLPIAVLLAFLLAAPFLTAGIVVASGSFFPMPPRYGLALMPALIVVTVPLLRNRWAIRALLAYVAILLGYGIAVTIAFAGWYP
ncbi:MAG TPA: hypothetical protein VNQ52_08835 [Microbacteriaceae bacterium]|nr:hypothetical protein [Microbacteriaceae bacterium]